MKILVINAGSSSIKYRLFDMDDNNLLAVGLAEKIGEKKGRVTFNQTSEEIVIADHQQGLNKIVELLSDPEKGVIKDKKEILAVGHRVVHGGEVFHKPTIIDDEVLEAIRANVPLAPLHNPANLTGIEVARAIFPEAKQVAVFDTAFHQTMPAKSFRYALPNEYYNKYRARRYGFHGTSHQFVVSEAANFLQIKPENFNAITFHLGNGASVAAVEKGKSVDTSMGLTPLEGLIMGTRCGDVDPALHFYLMRELNMPFEKLEKVMNKESGLKGLCGVNDVREIENLIEQGNKQAKLALEMYAYRVKKYLGSYYAILGRLDAIIFTAGIGENSSNIRKLICHGLENLGIMMDIEKNNSKDRGIRQVHSEQSKVKILVVPTNEELEIARQTKEILL